MTLSKHFWLLPLTCLSLLVPLPANAIIAAHISFNCGCHNLHNSAGASLLIALNSELTCLSCHGPLGTATEVTIHNPQGLLPGQQGYVTCRECHNAHDNLGGNIKLVGYDWDPEIDPAKSNLFSDPTIRAELSTTDPETPPVYRQVTFTGSTDFNIDNTVGGRGACEICHSPFHNQGNNCTTCHQHATGFSAAGGCTGCHDGTGVEALAVGPDSPHSETATGYTCAGCHSGHGSGTVEVPNNLAVGIYYVANDESGISLGSSTVSGNSEAEICWNCHAAEGVSEWGANTRAATGNSPYNYGSLTQANWTTAIWSSANFSYKTAAIQSTHAANAAATGPGMDAVDTIRCSYCHDVHELALAPNDTAAGKPYLRGTWIGNPYKEDGAPSNNPAGGKAGDVANYSAYDVTGKFGAIPRGGTTYTALGGYFIDQNSGYPTTTAARNSPDKFAGLCRLCHEGTNGIPDDGIWQAAEIDALNTFGTAGDDWVSNTNSHAAVVKGGSGIGAANLFTSAKRHQTPWSAYTGNGLPGGNPVMAYRNARSYGSKTKVWETAYWGQGLRGTDGTAFQYDPRVDTAGRQYNYQYYNWGATVVVEGVTGTMTDSGIDSNFHQFTCSKCHNPHASRLPRLLITNCLDTKHNTWDDAYVTLASDSNGSSSSLSLENRSVSLSQVTSAQNCHRLADPAYPQARPQGTATGGWNRVSPW